MSLIKDSKGQFSGLLAVIGGALLICAFVVGGIYFIVLGSSTFSVPVNQSQYQGFNQSQQVINITKQTQEQFIQYNSSGTSGLDIITVVTTGGYNTLKIIGLIPGVYWAFIGGIATVLGIPVDVANLAFMYVVAVIITIFVLLVFRVRS